jgi:homogentisate 1,2-dioxygenase
VDEVIYYVSGDFTSRSGIGTKSVTLHPAGIPHGPQPGKYEASLGATKTDELAVMLDSHERLTVAEAARTLEDDRYDASFSR